ncbi:hypothetical protein OJJOAM_003548 [Cupriavidus sp. H18C1]
MISQKAVLRNCRFSSIAVCAGACSMSATARPIAPPELTTRIASSRAEPSAPCASPAAMRLPNSSQLSGMPVSVPEVQAANAARKVRQ